MSDATLPTDGDRIFSIDPRLTFWPSDASLPLFQPHADDVRVLG